MKKLLFVFFILCAAIASAYNIAQSISFERGQITVAKKTSVPNYSFTAKNVNLSGVLMGPFMVSGATFTYCRNQYNSQCVLILEDTATSVFDTIQINFDMYSGVWLKPLPKALQPCNTPGITLKNFRVEGTQNFAYPGDTVGLDIYTVGPIINVFSNLYLKETGGSVVSNVVANPLMLWSNTFAKTFFILNDTLEVDKNYSVLGTVNCGNLPNHPNIGLIMSVQVFKKTPGYIWDMGQCNPNDVILIDVSTKPLAIDSTELESPQLGPSYTDTLSNLSVFPNPNAGDIHYSINGSEINLPIDWTVLLVDAKGQVLPILNKKNVADYASNGTYQLVISNNEGRRRSLKIIFEK